MAALSDFFIFAEEMGQESVRGKVSDGSGCWPQPLLEELVQVTEIPRNKMASELAFLQSTVLSITAEDVAQGTSMSTHLE